MKKHFNFLFLHEAGPLTELVSLHETTEERDGVILELQDLWRQACWMGWRKGRKEKLVMEPK